MECSVESVREICRICSQRKGEIHLRDNFVELENLAGTGTINSGVLTILELFHIFTNNEENFLELVNEIPLICEDCLKDLIFCYMFYNKVKVGHIYLKQLYEDSLNNIMHCKEEEDVMDKGEESNVNEFVENGENEEEYQLQNNEETTSNVSLLTPYKNNGETNTYIDAEEPEEFCQSVNISGKVSPESQECSNVVDDNFSVVIPQFLPAIYNSDSKDRSAKRKLMTIDCQTIQVTDLKQLQSVGVASEIFNNESSTGDDDTMYVCKYCPQAFANFSYLKSHLQTSHICKFCTKAFKLNTDLFEHIRKAHTEHKCVICNKKLSSHSNLRSHIKRVHDIKLPGDMALLDSIGKPSTYNADIVHLNYTASNLLGTCFEYIENASHNNEDI